MRSWATLGGPHHQPASRSWRPPVLAARERRPACPGLCRPQQLSRLRPPSARRAGPRFLCRMQDQGRVPRGVGSRVRATPASPVRQSLAPGRSHISRPGCCIDLSSPSYALRCGVFGSRLEMPFGARLFKLSGSAGWNEMDLPTLVQNHAATELERIWRGDCSVELGNAWHVGSLGGEVKRRLNASKGATRLCWLAACSRVTS